MIWLSKVQLPHFLQLFLKLSLEYENPKFRANISTRRGSNSLASASHTFSNICLVFSSTDSVVSSCSIVIYRAVLLLCGESPARNISYSRVSMGRLRLNFILLRNASCFCSIHCRFLFRNSNAPSRLVLVGQISTTLPCWIFIETYFARGFILRDISPS
jgi:hypothetical protein